MTSLRNGFKNQRGLGLYLILLIIFFLLPVMLVMLRKGISQNRYSLSDRNIRTSREMAESICYEFVNTFGENWNRNVFSDLFTVVGPTSFSGLGTVRYTVAKSTSQATMDIWTVATYNKGGTSLARATKGVDSLFYWPNDLFKFDLVWPDGAALGGNIDAFLSGMNSGVMMNSIYVGGNLNMGQNVTTIGGFFVVKGTMTVMAVTSLAPPFVHCVSWRDMALTLRPTTGVYQYPPDAFVPSLNIVPPEGAGMGGSLFRYFQNSTFSTAPVGGATLQLTLGVGGENYSITYVSDTGAVLSGPFVNPYFTPTASSTAPWVFASSGVNVEIMTSTVTRPISVAVLGGTARILGDVRYAPFGSGVGPSPSRSFALLSEGDLILDMPDPTSPPSLVLDGFYGSTQASIRILGDRSVTVQGTLYGPISEFALRFDTPFTVNASTGLLTNVPPQFPRRPRVVRWDYVP